MVRKKRFISRKVLEKAYRGPENLDMERIIDESEEDIIEKVDKLPEEIFQIIGKVVSFVEIADKIEEDKNENK